MLAYSLKKLLSIASPALLNADDMIDLSDLNSTEALIREISSVLRERNGFFAFEGALRFFPSRSIPASYGLSEWNDEGLWRGEYGGLADGCVFFAEDIFGFQFCIFNGLVCSFDAETGQKTKIAENLDGWAYAILDDYEFLTGHRIAHDWQSRNGALAMRDRLVAKIPFVLGGDYSISNLLALNSVKGMRARGSLACQIRDVPDGGAVRFIIS